MNIKDIYHFLSPKWQNLFMEYKVDFKPRYGHGKPPHNELFQIINSFRGDYGSWLKKSLKYSTDIQSIKRTGEEKTLNMPAWNNEYLPGLDMVMLYTLLCELKPSRYIEVGSGNSTQVAYKAKTGHKLQTQIISIDPHPRAMIDEISDKVIRQPFENTDISIFSQLGENDIVFIDNSHRMLPNSDATVFFMEVLPRLKKGVVVQLHDVYIPYDYPDFMCRRFYSEQYGLAICLLSNHEKFKPMVPNYFISEDPELSKIIEPIWNHPNLEGVERHGGSFWFVINETN